MAKKKEPSLKLMRHLLGSLDLSDIEPDKDQGEGERKDYCAAISIVYPRLKKDINKFLHEQLMFVSNQAGDWDQVLFGRGTFNGMDLLLDYWEKAHNEHIENSKPKEPFDKNNPIGEV